VSNDSVNNDSQPLGPVLDKLIEPTYQQGSNPTEPWMYYLLRLLDTIFRIRVLKSCQIWFTSDQHQYKTGSKIVMLGLSVPPNPCEYIHVIY